MKQVMTYVSPDGDFNEEHRMAVRIQIDNSLRLGWNREDILLATNFDFEHNGVKATVIGGENYCERMFHLTKIYVLVHLFENGLIGDGLYWYHDFDCFQLNEFTDIEGDMGDADLGLTNYGRRPRLCSASMFFRKGAGDILRKLKEEADSSGSDEEMSIMRMIKREPDTLGRRVKRLNTTYAFQKWNIATCYPTTNKPVKAAHFHLTPDKYDFYVRGENKLNMVLIPEGLIEIFHKYGFTGQ